MIKYRMSHEVVSIRAPWSYPEKLLSPNCSLLDVFSTSCNISLESLYPSEKNPISRNIFNALQNMSDYLEKCFPIREFVSCQELFDVAEEIEVRGCQTFEGHSRRMWACLIGMDHQFSIASTDLSFAPF
jgi:hypothetical protein